MEEKLTAEDTVFDLPRTSDQSGFLNVDTFPLEDQKQHFSAYVLGTLLYRVRKQWRQHTICSSKRSRVKGRLNH
jgi:hypothetical protein